MEPMAGTRRATSPAACSRASRPTDRDLHGERHAGARRHRRGAGARPPRPRRPVGHRLRRHRGGRLRRPDDRSASSSSSPGAAARRSCWPRSTTRSDEPPVVAPGARARGPRDHGASEGGPWMRTRLNGLAARLGTQWRRSFMVRNRSHGGRIASVPARSPRRRSDRCHHGRGVRRARSGVVTRRRPRPRPPASDAPPAPRRRAPRRRPPAPPPRARPAGRIRSS